MNSVKLLISGIGHVPSKKNHHFPGPNGRLLIDKSIKERMALLEDAILYQLYSECLTNENETASVCLKRLRTLLSGLCDDSIREIPTASFTSEPTLKGCECIEITITELEETTETERIVYETIAGPP